MQLKSNMNCQDPGIFFVDWSRTWRTINKPKYHTPYQLGESLRLLQCSADTRYMVDACDGYFVVYFCGDHRLKITELAAEHSIPRKRQHS